MGGRLRGTEELGGMEKDCSKAGPTPGQFKRNGGGLKGYMDTHTFPTVGISPLHEHDFAQNAVSFLLVCLILSDMEMQTSPATSTSSRCHSPKNLGLTSLVLCGSSLPEALHFARR